jgi:hypothetical protein
MYEQQLDLFSSASIQVDRPVPLSMELRPAATVLDDRALIAAIPDSNLADSIALAAEAGRRSRYPRQRLWLRAPVPLAALPAPVRQLLHGVGIKLAGQAGNGLLALGIRAVAGGTGGNIGLWDALIVDAFPSAKEIARPAADRPRPRGLPPAGACPMADGRAAKAGAGSV